MNNDDLKKIGQLLDDRLAATEKRFEARLDERLEETEKNILVEIGRFVSDQLLPQIDEKADKKDIERLEHKLDYYSARIMENGHRLDIIESLPTVAHELKLRKKKD